jgi:tRNA A-37 threonylcarbamoyl transferase component Bud32
VTLASMTPERWQQVDRVFQAAVDLPPGDRPAFLAEACQADDELRREVESLIESHEQAGSFIENATLETTAPFARDEHPDRLGPYRILRELGRGGMGRVYLAEQEGEGFRRQVALKVIERHADDTEVGRRFREERRILAGLEHPGIARFYDAGRSSEGAWFLALEYVEGQDLRTFVERRGLDLRSRVGLFLQVLDAVDFAHRRLVIHRDLKPGNVLVDAQGRAKLLDFGIAKILDPEQDAEDTRTQRPAFTLAYASPEQLRGERITVATDVYSAGVMLYELLVGRRPFDRPATTSPVPDPQAPSTAARQRAATVREGPENGPLVRWRDLAGDLDAITLKALRPSPDSRYPSAASFAEDLRRWQAGEPVEARRGGRRYRLAKFVTRHHVALAAAAAVLLALAGGLSVALLQRSRALAAQAQAERTVADLHALTQSMLFEIHDGVRLLPNSLKVRDTILQKATEVLDRLSTTAGDDPRLLADLASGYRQLGTLYKAHPAFGGRSFGQPKVAIRHFERARLLRERVAALPGAGFDERLAAARSLLDLAQPQLYAGDAAAFTRSIEAGLSRLQALEGAAPDPTVLLFWRAAAHTRAWHHATVFPSLAPTAEANGSAASRLWLEFLAAPSPGVTGAEFVVDADWATLLLYDKGHRQEALRLNDLTLRALDQGAMGGPETYQAVHWRAQVMVRRAKVMESLQRPAEALAACKEMLRLNRSLPVDGDSTLFNNIKNIGDQQVAADLAVQAGDLEFAEQAWAEAGGALAEAERRYGSAAFASARFEQQQRRAAILAARAARAPSPAQARQLRAAALEAYREALRQGERIEAAGQGHGLDEKELAHLRHQIERLQAARRAP